MGIFEHLTRRSFFSTSIQNKGSYIDKWFGSIVKPETFYEIHANGKIRRYFYNIDMHGRLFLEETLPKNIASSIKDPKFLDFFFSRVRWATPIETDFLKSTGFSNQYPFVALCGREVNFIRPACSPIVFHSLVDSGGNLVYGGNLKQPFEPSNLAISKATGKLFHKLVKPMVEPESSKSLEYGLVRSSIAITLSDRILPGDADENWTFLRISGELGEPIEWLPEENEPGEWAMPDDNMQI